MSQACGACLHQPCDLCRAKIQQQQCSFCKSLNSCVCSGRTLPWWWQMVLAVLLALALTMLLVVHQVLSVCRNITLCVTLGAVLKPIKPGRLTVPLILTGRWTRA